MSGRQDFAPNALPHQVVAFREIVYLGQVLRYLYDRRLAGDGLSTAQAMVLSAAQRPGDPPSLTGLAADLATSHQNVAVLLRGLEERGFVRMTRDPDDRRVRRVAVTDDCRRYFAARDDADAEYLAGLFAVLDEDEVRQLVDLLDRVLAVALAEHREHR